jgi:hypothetical protein
MANALLIVSVIVVPLLLLLFNLLVLLRFQDAERTRDSVLAKVGFVLLLAGFPAVLDYLRGWAPRGVVEGLASTSAFSHYDSMMRGVIDLRDLLYFLLVIAAFLVINVFTIDWKKSD